VIAPVIFLTVVDRHLHMGDMRKSAASAARRCCIFEIVSTIALAFGHDRRQSAPARPRRFDRRRQARHGQAVRGAGQVVRHDDVHAQSGTGDFIGAFAKGDLIPILIIAILSVPALTRLRATARPSRSCWKKSATSSFGIIGIVMYVAPLALWVRLAYTIGVNGVGVLVNLGELMACVYLTMAAFVVVCLG